MSKYYLSVYVCCCAESCLEVVCKYGARCRAGVCVCPTDCPQHLDEPVCASNLDTYDNECDMQKQACAFNPPALLTVIFFGACSIKFKINRSSKFKLMVTYCNFESCAMHQILFIYMSFFIPKRVGKTLYSLYFLQHFCFKAQISIF